MASSMMKKTLFITNMTCAHCESRIETELEAQQGISNVTASYVSGTVIVTYDGNVISLDRIIEILESIDYHVYKVDVMNQESMGNKAMRSKDMSNRGMNSKDLNSKASGRTHELKKEQKAGRDYSNVIGVAVIIFALYLIAKKFGLIQIFYNFPVAKEGMGYGMLFIIGLLTSIHCVAMCGGICLSQSIPKEGSTNSIGRLSSMKPSLLYNIGRVISYTIIGGIVGAIGSVVSFSGPMKGFVQILAGIFMVIMGINMLGIFAWLRRFNPRMPKVFAKKINAQRSGHGPLYIGLLNGLMPCGPLQAMQLYALSTGSPVKGALSMLIFSLGTVPLLFAFGAVSTFLNKRFTGKMMTASAMLVVVLGVFMLSSGMNLSGVLMPSLTTQASTEKTANEASLQDGVQVITSGISPGGYEPIIVQKGIPVKWTIKVEPGDLNGCNSDIIIRKYGIEKALQTGDNVIEFTPTESGTVPFSCWMGMINSKIVVVDDLNRVDNNLITNIPSQSSGGGCCAR